MADKGIPGKGAAPTAAIELLVRSGRYDEAAARTRAEINGNERDAAMWYQLAAIESERRRFRAALTAVERALALDRSNVVFRRFRGMILANLQRGAEAIAVLSPIVEADPGDKVALTALQIAHYHAGNTEQAVALGARVLEIEDHAGSVAGRPSMATTQTQRIRGLRKRVIAYSLWGRDPAYNYGAMINARLARFIYPRWKCRFYLGGDVPQATIRMLERAGAETVFAAKAHGNIPGAVWRFLVADDPEVGIFLCRDCDARLSPKEAAAVDAWMRSGRSFHVMRDHVLHRNVMLSGLWGGRTTTRLAVRERIKRYFAGGADLRYGADQAFLAREIWPVIRDDCLVHDSYYRLFDAQPFPAMGRGNAASHVGMGITNRELLREEAVLFGLPWPPEKVLF